MLDTMTTEKFNLGYVVVSMDEANLHANWAVVSGQHSDSRSYLGRSFMFAQTVDTVGRAIKLLDTVRARKVPLTKKEMGGVVANPDDFAIRELSATLSMREITPKDHEKLLAYATLNADVECRNRSGDLSNYEASKIKGSLTVEFNLDRDLALPVTLPNMKASLIAPVVVDNGLSFLSADGTTRDIRRAAVCDDIHHVVRRIKYHTQKFAAPKQIFVGVANYALSDALSEKEIDERLIPDALTKLSSAGRDAYELLSAPRMA